MMTRKMLSFLFLLLLIIPEWSSAELRLIKSIDDAYVSIDREATRRSLSDSEELYDIFKAKSLSYASSQAKKPIEDNLGNILTLF